MSTGRFSQKGLPASRGIPMGKQLPKKDGNYLVHSCGTIISSESYGGNIDKVRCPVCHIIILLHALRCQHCGVCCGTQIDRDIHERFCDGRQPIDDPGKPIPSPRKVIWKPRWDPKLSQSAAMRERWQDPAFTQKAIQRAKESWKRRREQKTSNNVGEVAA